MNNQTIEELNSRNLDPCYFSLLVFPIKIYFKDVDNSVNIKTIYVFYGCNINGVRKYITSVFLENNSKTSEWYDLLQVLKRRGINSILYAVLPKCEYLKNALKLAFPDIEIFPSPIDTLNTISKYYSCKYSSSILNTIKKIYVSPSANEYNLALNEFYETFSDNHFIIDLIDDDLKKAKNIYSYDFIIRKNIYSYYFQRDFIKILNKHSNSKPYFSSINEFVSLLIPTIITNEHGMFCSKCDWSNVINKIYDSKKNLIISYL